ncbi:MAG TPA: NAD(P)/FAD-dependent oxidoreductase [Puia sp.]|nr:NAD(P)/FAD-dependent oxidoreductase [Puia sp.]
MILLQDKKVAIVGAGPGGLTLAKLLQLKGAHVKLYERDFDKHARVQGSPLDLHDDTGLAAIRKANLLNEFRQNFLPQADRKLITNERAEIFFSDHDIKPDENFGSDHFRPEIDRGTLRKILLDSLQPETVVWNSHFISMEAQNEGWLLHFKNGSSHYADLVIGADGANSKIRSYITYIKAFYSGITMLEGNIYEAAKAAPHMNKFLKGGKIMAFGNSKDLFIGQKGNGDIGFGASFRADESWATNNGLNYADRMQVLNWFTTEYYGWSSIWNELFENAATPFVPRPIYCMPPDQTWEPMSNLTMLGDAAHVMPPFAGEGANVAMWDALELSAHLTGEKYHSLKEAIAHFEIVMRKRAAVAAAESLENGEKMHSEGALNIMLQFFNVH